MNIQLNYAYNLLCFTSKLIQYLEDTAKDEIYIQTQKDIFTRFSKELFNLEKSEVKND